jgi:putative colanic acid biosynthesis acetyltransferase WcaF
MNPSGTDPYERPAFSLRHRMARFCWGIAYTCLFRTSPKPFHFWRATLLRAFGAKLGPRTHIYPAARIWAPWNLTCDEHACIADRAIVYNPAPVHMGSHSILSQEAYLCGATHDYNEPAFPLVSAPITLGAYSWVCARSTVQAGVSLSEGAVLGLGSVATRDLEAWTVYGGVPARKIKARRREPSPAEPVR